MTFYVMPTLVLSVGSCLLREHSTSFSCRVHMYIATTFYVMPTLAPSVSGYLPVCIGMSLSCTVAVIFYLMPTLAPA